MKGVPQWLYPANVLTELRIATIPAIVWQIFAGRFGWALGLMFLAGVSDGFDGWLARHFHQQSALGALLDPIADKGLLSTLFIVLAVVGRLPWALTILVFVRDACIVTTALVLYTRTGFHDFRPTWWGKACTTASLSTIGAALWLAAAPNLFLYWLVRFGWLSVTLFSLFSGIHYSFAAAMRYNTTRERAPAS